MNLQIIRFRNVATLLFAGAALLLLAPALRAELLSMDYIKQYDKGQKVKVWRGVEADIKLYGPFMDMATRAEVRKKNGDMFSGATTSLVNKNPSRITVNVKLPSSADADEYEVWLRFAVEVSGPEKFTVRVYDRGKVESISLVSDAAAPAIGARANDLQRVPVPGRSSATQLQNLQLGEQRLKIGADYIIEVRGEGLGNVAFDPRANGSLNINLDADYEVTERSSASARVTVRFKKPIKSFAVRPFMFFDKDLSSSRMPEGFIGVAGFTGAGSFEKEVIINPTITRIATPEARVGDQIVIQGSLLDPVQYNKALLVGVSAFPMQGNDEALSVVAAASMDRTPLKIRYQAKGGLSLPEIVVDVPGQIQVGYTLEVTVKTQTGALVAGATVCAGTADAPGRAGSGVTNAQGVATLVLPGKRDYELFVSTNGVARLKTQVPVSSGPVARMNVSINPNGASIGTPACP